MHPRTLDHIAVRVNERAAVAEAFVTQLDMHVIDNSERLTLLGPSARGGKVTLFDASPDLATAPHGALVSLALADFEAREPLVIGGLKLTFVERSDVERHALVGATLRSNDPAAAAALYARTFGFVSQSVDERECHVTVADSVLTLVRDVATPLASAAADGVLHHIGLLVDSAASHVASAHRLGIRIVDTVDTKNTRAVFVAGPDDVCLEYVEHKPEFALV